MKKNKNHASEEPEVRTAENKQNGKNTKNIPEITPADKLRLKDGADGELTFKKVLYGYDPEEVNSYIEELNKTYNAANRNYENRLSSLKEELQLSNRERDSYSEKYRKNKVELDAATEGIPLHSRAADKGISEKYEAEIASLKEKLEQMQAENNKLREEYAVIERENEQISLLTQKYDSLFSDYKDVSSQLEAAKSEKSRCETELNIAKQSLEERTLEFIEISAQADDDKKKSAELEVKNEVLLRQIEENENEILHLKEMNKTKAYEYADKVGQLESEYTRSKIVLQRELKLQDYYISQTELTLSELTKQIEQIKQSFSESRAE